MCLDSKYVTPLSKPIILKKYAAKKPDLKKKICTSIMFEPLVSTTLAH